jgi:hypothetical protein
MAPDKMAAANRRSTGLGKGRHLEEDGFDLPVSPRERRIGSLGCGASTIRMVGTDCSPCLVTRRCRSGLRDKAEGKQRDHENRTESRAEPEVRIQFPPPVSQLRT